MAHNLRLFSCLIALLSLCFAVPSHAAIESSLGLEFKVNGTPVDSTASADGKYFYILTAEGSVEIYNATGKIEGTVNVDSKYDLITVNPKGTALFLTDKESQATQLVNIDFIFPINVENSPYKGPANAPVVIAVFSDFQ